MEIVAAEAAIVVAIIAEDRKVAATAVDTIAEDRKVADRADIIVDRKVADKVDTKVQAEDLRTAHVHHKLHHNLHRKEATVNDITKES